MILEITLPLANTRIMCVNWCYCDKRECATQCMQVQMIFTTKLVTMYVGGVLSPYLSWL